MKFKQVVIGQRFRYQKKLYTKTGPFQALEEGSENPRMIIQAAEVSLIEGGEVPPGTEDAAPDLNCLRKLLERYHRQSLALIQQADPVSEQDRQNLDELYQKIVSCLD